MKSTKAAARYAKALLELAVENNKVDQIASDMKYLVQVSAETPEFQIVMNSPVVNSDKKLSIFAELFGSFDQITSKFMELITKNRREYMLVQIAEAYGEQLNTMRGIVPLTLISAVPLNDKIKKDILGKVESAVKGKLDVTEMIDETLIGGFIIRMGDKQIDASISSQLSNLKQLLTR